MLYVNNCCCACLSTESLLNVHSKDVDNVKLLDKILFCLTEKDSIFDCAPLLICEKCSKTTTEMYIFKKNSMKTLDLFRNCLKQLIKNPFSDLVLDVMQTNDNNKQVGENSNIVVVKIEPLTNEDNFNEDNTVNTAENSSLNEIQPLSIKIDNVQSLNKHFNNSKINENNIENGGSSSEDAILDPKRRFKKKTICHPCGKKFVRDEYFINHILTCSKNDIKTKYSVLNWVSKQTKRKIVSGEINIDPILLKIISSPNFKTREERMEANLLDENPKINVASCSKMKNNAMYVKNIVKPKIEKLERTVCFLCKRRITARFFRRHFVKCNKVREEKQALLMKNEMLLTASKRETNERATPTDAMEQGKTSEAYTN